MTDATYWDGQAATFDNEADHGLRDPRVRDAWRRLLLAHLPAARRPWPTSAAVPGPCRWLLAAQGYAVTGLDFAPAMIKEARAKARAADVTGSACHSLYISSASARPSAS